MFSSGGVAQNFLKFDDEPAFSFICPNLTYMEVIEWLMLVYRCHQSGPIFSEHIMTASLRISRLCSIRLDTVDDGTIVGLLLLCIFPSLFLKSAHAGHIHFDRRTHC